MKGILLIGSIIVALQASVMYGGYRETESGREYFPDKIVIANSTLETASIGVPGKVEKLEPGDTLEIAVNEDPRGNNYFKEIWVLRYQAAHVQIMYKVSPGPTKGTSWGVVDIKDIMELPKEHGEIHASLDVESDQ